MNLHPKTIAATGMEEIRIHTGKGILTMNTAMTGCCLMGVPGNFLEDVLGEAFGHKYAAIRGVQQKKTWIEVLDYLNDIAVVALVAKATGDLAISCPRG